MQLDIIRGELSLAISRGLHAAGARFTLPPQVIETVCPPPPSPFAQGMWLPAAGLLRS